MGYRLILLAGALLVTGCIERAPGAPVTVTRPA
jgi:hypothetical protein